MLDWIPPDAAPDSFPDTAHALRDPDGLLAAGGDLSPARLLAAYRRGIFPWYSPGQPILWWCPDPRAVLFTDRVHVSRRLARVLRQQRFTLSMDRAFGEVVAVCARVPRRGQDSTWITEEMQAAYRILHEQGHAHSVEVWQNETLVGGLYGVAVGRVFFGESMFSRVSDASKIALVSLARQLARWGFPLVDCQVASAHLERLGARGIPRTEFLALLGELCPQPGPAAWTFARGDT